MDVVKLILENLPPTVDFEGLVFELSLIKNAEKELRLCYGLINCEKGSPHFLLYDRSCQLWDNKFTGSVTDYLVLYENISDDQQLVKAVNWCRNFLTDNKIIE